MQHRERCDSFGYERSFLQEWHCCVLICLGKPSYQHPGMATDGKKMKDCNDVLMMTLIVICNDAEIRSHTPGQHKARSAEPSYLIITNSLGPFTTFFVCVVVFVC